MSPDRWKITCAPGRARIEAVYCRGLGRATRSPLLRMKSRVASSMRPLLGSARRSLSEVMVGKAHSSMGRRQVAARKLRVMRAIILAGGQGERLRPLTADRPKCLVEVAGKTLVEHQLGWLADQGVTEIAISCGYKWQRIEDLVGDGSRFGVRVSY